MPQRRTRWQRCAIGLVALLGLSVMSSGGADQQVAGTPDDSFRERDQALLHEFERTRSRCEGHWNEPACLTELAGLRGSELVLFRAVQDHQFTDVTASNYWHRGRLKFPSQIALEWERTLDTRRSAR